MVSESWKPFFLLATLWLGGCLPWRSQRDDQGEASLDWQDWEEFLTADSSAGFDTLKSTLLRNGPSLEAFMSPGPVQYKVYENRLATWRDNTQIVYDSVVPQSASPTPLVVIVHGNHSHKEAHRYQAERLASFGIHAIVLQVPNQGQWVFNGELIRKFITRLRNVPETFGGRIDRKNIILAGHSFGGSAVTIATGRGAKVRGLMLLDPAVVSDSVLDSMKSVTRPTMLLSSDSRIFRARRQSEFARHIQGEFISIGVAGATHDDAQFPSMYSQTAYGYDPFTSIEKQEVFAAALTLGAFSLGATGRLTFAMEALTPMIKGGELLHVKRRPALKSDWRFPRRS